MMHKLLWLSCLYGWISKKFRIFLSKLLTTPIFMLYICTVNRRLSTQGFQHSVLDCSKLFQQHTRLDIREFYPIFDSYEQSINTLNNIFSL